MHTDCKSIFVTSHFSIKLKKKKKKNNDLCWQPAERICLFQFHYSLCQHSFYLASNTYQSASNININYISMLKSLHYLLLFNILVFYLLLSNKIFIAQKINGVIYFKQVYSYFIIVVQLAGSIYTWCNHY